MTNINFNDPAKLEIKCILCNANGKYCDRCEAEGYIQYDLSGGSKDCQLCSYISDDERSFQRIEEIDNEGKKHIIQICNNHIADIEDYN